ncbi:MAG: alpha/beta hydrolase [Aureispira sp.]|nr:alpha/beta hydrolase [Aureispira sp.]
MSTDIPSIDLAELSPHPIRKATIKGLEYYYIDKGEGPVVLLLHGFPDNAATYDKTIDVLAANGHRAIAPFMRGYYPTALAPDNDYKVKTIAEDMVALLDYLGEQEVFLVGHDWGASVAYMITNLVPERIKKLTTIAIPHPRALKISLGLFLRARHFVLFQFGSYAHWYTKRNNFAYLDYIFKYWAPSWAISDKQRDLVKRSFAQPGYLEAAIGYYASTRKSLKDKEEQRLARKKTTVPTLTFAGIEDGALDISKFDNMASAIDNDFELVKVEGAGHFPHCENPELFNAKLLEFLNK